MKLSKPFSTSLLSAIALSFFSHTAFASDDEHEEGEKLYKNYCMACHGATGGMDFNKRIAPPIAGVRRHYIGPYPDKDSFVLAVTQWLENQDESNSLMPGAIQKFKIMPPISVPKQDAEKIAAYIYAGDIETPAGFAEHVEQMHGKGMQGRGMGHMYGKGMQGQGMGQMRGKGMQGQGKRNGIRSIMRQLDLSPAQQQKIQALINEKDVISKSLMQQKQQINQRIFNLDASSPNFKTDVFTLADEQARLVQRMTIEKAEMRYKIESLLSPDQRQKFSQLRGKKN